MDADIELLALAGTSRIFFIIVLSLALPKSEVPNIAESSGGKPLSITRLIGVIFFTYALFSASSAHAWWQSGHEAICELALRSVKPEVRTRIESLLDEPFPSTCGWADEVRPDRPETSPWHYINSTPTLASFNHHPRPASGDILTAIEEQSDLLRHSADPVVRAEALRWLGHLIGDLHQPMHVAFEEDWGGNRYRLTLPPSLREQLGEERSQVNMHSVWDGLIIRHAEITESKPVVSLLRESPLTTLGNPVIWADEGLELLHRPDVRYWPGTRMETLSEDYLVTHRDLVLQRLSLAGMRLAALLNRLMTPTHGPEITNDVSSSH